MSKDVQASGGIGFLGLLTVLFVGLKLTGFISWSWWMVTMPLWLFPVVLLTGITGLWLFGLGVMLLEKR